MKAIANPSRLFADVIPCDAWSYSAPPLNGHPTSKPVMWICLWISNPSSQMGPADQYFGLLADLETLLDRPVDLVCVKAMRNPWFIQEVNRSRNLLYAA